MRHLSNIALLLTLVPCAAAAPAVPGSGAWQWQRVIVPATPAREQCVVLDGELYHDAAPGLADVRLLQEGRQVAYALEESHDAAYDARLPGATQQDRAIYTTVQQIPLRSIAGESPHETGSGVLPAHVPVERLYFVFDRVPGNPSEQPSPKAAFRMVASPAGKTPQTSVAADEGEVIEGTVAPLQPAVLTAIGANLQEDASVSVNVAHGGGNVSRVLLQMRQRLLCFQPLSPAPLLLLLGNPMARPPHYEYALHYQPVETPLLTQLGPTERNPAFRTRAPQREFLFSSRERMISAVVVAAAVVFLLLPTLVTRRR